MDVTSKDFKAPSRDQLREARAQRARLAGKVSDVLADLSSIAEAQRSPALHIDPSEHISRLKQAALFSAVPDEWRPRRSGRPGPHRAPAKGGDGKAASRVKPLMKNPDFDETLKARAPLPATTHAAIVDVKRPLMISWDAATACGKNKKNAPGAAAGAQVAASQYAGLFSQHGTAPVYTPPEVNRRREVAEKLAARKKARIAVSKENRKARLMAVPQKPPQKVPKSFVPRCCTAGSNNESARRQEVARAQAEDKAKRPSTRPFH